MDMHKPSTSSWISFKYHEKSPCHKYVKFLPHFWVFKLIRICKYKFSFYFWAKLSHWGWDVCHDKSSITLHNVVTWPSRCEFVNKYYWVISLVSHLCICPCMAVVQCVIIVPSAVAPHFRYSGSNKGSPSTTFSLDGLCPHHEQTFAAQYMAQQIQNLQCGGNT